MGKKYHTKNKKKVIDKNRKRATKKQIEEYAQDKLDTEVIEKKKEGKKRKLDAEVSAHMEELKELEKSQAEFFKFLEKEDAGLLRFGEDENDLLEEDDEKESEMPVGTITLTEELLLKWEGECHKNLGAVKKIIKAFHVACGINKLKEEDEKQYPFEFKYRIVNSSIFNEIMMFSLKEMCDIFDTHLKRDRVAEMEKGPEDSNRPVNLPQKYTHQWDKIKNMVRVYLRSLLQFLSSLTEPKMILFVLKATEQMIEYFAPFTKHSASFLKKLLKLWESSDEAVRIAAFLNIRGLALRLPYPSINDCLKGIYLTYVRNAKFCDIKTIALVNFMSNCVVELYGIDFVASYQHAFVYIRQIAIHLRTAFNRLKLESPDTVYNWQMLHSVQLWVKVLCTYPHQEELWLLAFPLVQVIHGIISLRSIPTLYPLRLHCVEMLNDLVRARNPIKPFFVNSLPYLLEILGDPRFYTKPKSAGKPIHLKFMLKASDKLIVTKQFMDAVLISMHTQLVVFLSSFSRSIAFPELALPVVTQITQFLQKCCPTPCAVRIRLLLDTIKNNSKLVLAQRNLISFSPSDTQKVSNFMSNFKHSTPLELYCEQYLKQLKEEQKLMEQVENKKSNEIEDKEEDEPEDSDDREVEAKEEVEAEEEVEADEEVEEQEDNDGEEDEVKEFDLQQF